MKLTIIIPCFNEEKRLPGTLKKISTYIKEKNFEATILVIDDGSTDKTAYIAKKKAQVLRLRDNQGKGAAVRAGVLATKTPWVLFTDADLSTPIEELEHFIEQSQKYDLLIASRNLPTSHIRLKQPFLRSMLGKEFARLVPLLLELNISDTQCGFKLMRTSCAQKIMEKMKTRGWAFDAELLFYANKTGMRIKEIPVHWDNSAQSKVNSLTAPFQMLRDVLKIRWRGFYEK